MKDRLIIIGASGHGKVALDIAIKVRIWSKISFLDDNNEIGNLNEYPVIGKIADAEKFKNESDFFVAIGNNEVRFEIQKKLLSKKCSIAILIHPFSSIAIDTHIGIGTLIAAGVVVNSSTEIGQGCIINTSSSIDHDCSIGDFSHIAPGCHIAGNVKIGKFNWIGIGTTMINNITTIDNVLIGAHSLVLKNISQQGTFFGSPIVEKNRL